MASRRLIQCLLACVVVTAAAAWGPAASAAEPEERPSILLVLTDDQRWDTLGVMPTVQRELVGRGVTFTEAVAVNPLCCPSRATILTGQYSHTTGVYSNLPPYGGSQWFDDDSTIVVFTNHAFPEYEAACMQLGADYFFDKSNQIGPLKDLLHALHRSKMSHA